MYAHLSLLLNICFLRKGPQDIAHSPKILRLTLLAYAAVSFLIIQISTDSLSALLQVMTEIMISLSFVALLLTMVNKPFRFIQTTCTLLGTDAMISAFAMPIIATLSLDSNNILALISMLALMLWHWVVTAHIVRHAIDKAFSFALGISFLYLLVAFQIIGILFPPANASA